MAIPTSGYPTTLDDTNATPSATVEFPQPASSTDLDATNVEHDLLHKNLSLSIVALQTKLGITDSNPTSGTILQGTGSGSAWSSTLPSVGFGTDGSGVDVTFYSATAGDNMLWDASEEKLVITGTNGQTALDVADGDVTIADALTVTGAVTAGSLVAPLAINAQTGTTYTFVAADAGKLVTSSNGSAQTITIPPNSSVAFDIGTQIMVQNLGSANATLAQGSGVTIQSKDSAKEIDGQYAAATCIKTATDTWSLIGALA
jgi:hypothetical protein